MPCKYVCSCCLFLQLCLGWVESARWRILNTDCVRSFVILVLLVQWLLAHLIHTVNMIFQGTLIVSEDFGTEGVICGDVSVAWIWGSKMSQFVSLGWGRNTFEVMGFWPAYCFHILLNPQIIYINYFEPRVSHQFPCHVLIFIEVLTS